MHIGHDLSRLLHKELEGGRRAVALVDAHLPVVQAERLDSYLRDIPRLIVPRGEGSKTLSHLEGFANDLLALGLGRDGLLVALGGGVTGDLCGTLAASYFRGIPFIQIPTTLLAQIDSSVGGKVAVNLQGAKNAMGYFHQPRAVIADLAFLDTLEAREKRAGFAEMIKMAAIADESLLDTLESKLDSLLTKSGAELEAAIERSCILKAKVVEQDERESGLREILNFGHTLGHAVESSGLEPTWLHGECVALGMVAALSLGDLLNMGESGMLARMENLLRAADLPVRLPRNLSPERILETLSHDKKAREGKSRWVLLENWAQPRWGLDVPEKALLQVLDQLRS
ncbi:3-dehydroquinate synthase [bacterium]|nr:3-dehydroquinate synthase [bacterium]